MDCATERRALFMLHTVIAGKGISVMGSELVDMDTMTGCWVQLTHRLFISNAAVTIARMNAPNQNNLLIHFYFLNN